MKAFCARGTVSSSTLLLSLGIGNGPLYGSEPDTLVREHVRPRVVVGVGTNIFTAREMQLGGTATFSTTKPFSHGPAL